MAHFRPMHEMLLRNRNRLRLHVPGHKGRALFETDPAQVWDVTELPVTDDLYAPFGPIQKAQEKMAASAGAGCTLFLTGGSTAGILAMLLYSAGPGDTVILPRNAHFSCISGCILADLRPVYVPVRTTEDGYPYAAEADVLQAIHDNPKAKAVLITRPDYYGGMIPLARVAAAAHAKGMRLLVDEAHGAHLNWLAGAKTAAGGGADVWVQSAHKTLPALTAGAFLHLAPGEDGERALRMLRMVQTSSPAFYLMKSLDDARAWMDAYGASALQTLGERLAALRAGLERRGYSDAHKAWRGLPLIFDATRLVIAAPQGGYTLAQSLSRRGVDVEMADDRRIVCILTVMDGEETFARLAKALEETAGMPAVMGKECSFDPALPRQLLSPRQAALGRQEWVDGGQAAGRVSAASAGLYPPGIPLIAPGEEITAQTVSRLLAAPEGSRFGMRGRQLLCVVE